MYALPREGCVHEVNSRRVLSARCHPHRRKAPVVDGINSRRLDGFGGFVPRPETGRNDNPRHLAVAEGELRHKVASTPATIRLFVAIVLPRLDVVISIEHVQVVHIHELSRVAFVLHRGIHLRRFQRRGVKRSERVALELSAADGEDDGSQVLVEHPRNLRRTKLHVHEALRRRVPARVPAIGRFERATVGGVGALEIPLDPRVLKVRE